MEDLINPLLQTLYARYGFLNPAQLGIFSQAEPQTAQASTQYQDAYTLDRLVGTSRAILRDTHYDQDLPALESALGNIFGEYKDAVISAGVHLAQVARTFQDYGQGRQVNFAGADIRSSSTLNTISSTTYVLETGAALLNAKQLVQQSAYTHIVSDLYQCFSQQFLTRSEQEIHQSNKVLIHSDDYEVSAAKVLEQAGNRTIYADELKISVGAETPFYQQSKGLSISSSKAEFDFDDLTFKTEKTSQASSQHDLYADRLSVSGNQAVFYGNTASLGSGGVLRLSGSLVMINSNRVAAPGRPPVEVMERHKPTKYVEIPAYTKTPLLRTQSASGIQVGDQEVLSPPQGTAGAYSGISAAGRITPTPVTNPVYNQETDTPDTSISRPSL